MADHAALADPRPAPSVGPSLARHGLALLIILAAGALTFSRALDIRPFQWDNVFSMSVAIEPSPWKLVTEPSGGEPAYRPLALFSIWLQRWSADVDARPYFLFNQVSWLGCAFALYALAYLLSRSHIAALVSGLALLFDDRATELLTWIDDRQTSIAVLGGLLALIVVAAPRRHRWPGAARFSVFLLLLCAALGKEYGLAFSGAAVAFALASWRERRHDAMWVLLVVGGVAGAYFLLRWGLARESLSQDFCQEMSFFRVRVNQQVCLSQMDVGARAAQFAYNSGATLVGTPMPWLFTWTGAPVWPEFNSWVPVLDILALGLALIGTIRAHRQTLPLLSLVLFQALLSFMLYRDRNHLVGAAGLYAAAGIGLAMLLNDLRGTRAARGVAAAMVALLLVVLALNARSLARRLDEERKDAMKIDPCRWVKDPLVNAETIHRMKLRYGLNNPDCT